MSDLLLKEHFAPPELNNIQVPRVHKHFVPTGLKAMSDERINATESEAPDLDQTELAHSIIESLLDHTRVVSDLIALMAQALDQDTTKALTMTPQWQAYLESRRRMEQTRVEVEKFVDLIKPANKD